MNDDQFRAHQADILSRAKRTEPSWSVYRGGHINYKAHANTDIAARFERMKAEQQAQQPQPANVQQIKKRKGA